MTSYPLLLSLGRVGDITLANRIVMSPMTRFRISPTGAPKALNIEYYRQRASAGLIITEALYVEPRGRQSALTGGLSSPEQVAGWSAITKPVKCAGGRMFAQLFHAGRVSHPVFQPGGALPIAPSAIAMPGLVRSEENGATVKTPAPTPRALGLAEIGPIIDAFKSATESAHQAGFDGVELHAGSGLLHQQFLTPCTNRREDAYGGDVARRCRFVIETLEAMAEVRGPSRVGIKIAPNFAYNGIRMSMDDIVETYGYLISKLSHLGLAYLHVQYPPWGLFTGDPAFNPIDFARPLYSGTVIGAGEFNRDTAESALRNRRCDLIAFGRRFIANPDLPRRIRLGAPENSWDEATLYSAESSGFTDYPALGEAWPC